MKKLFLVVLTFGFVGSVWATPTITGKLNSSQKQVRAEFATQPMVNLNSPFVLGFEGGLPANATIEVDIFMPNMGHGSKPVKLTTFSDSGVVYVDQVYFLMGGDWQIRVRVTDEKNDSVDRVDLDVDIR